MVSGTIAGRVTRILLDGGQIVIYGFMFALEACRESTPEFTVTGIVAKANKQTMYMKNIGLGTASVIKL